MSGTSSAHGEIGISVPDTTPLLHSLTSMEGGNANKCREHLWPWRSGISLIDRSLYKKAPRDDRAYST